MTIRENNRLRVCRKVGNCKLGEILLVFCSYLGVRPICDCSPHLIRIKTSLNVFSFQHYRFRTIDIAAFRQGADLSNGDSWGLGKIRIFQSFQLRQMHFPDPAL